MCTLPLFHLLMHVRSYNVCLFWLSSVQMYAGKEQRSDLINELRTTHALQSPEQREKKREKEEITRKQAHKLVSRIRHGARKYLSLCLHCRSAAEHSEAVVNDAVEEGAALCVGQQLDFLHKELERLQVCCTCTCTCICVLLWNTVLVAVVHM